MTKAAKDIHAKFEAESDALWQAYSSGKLSHKEYRLSLNPLEEKLRADLANARASTCKEETPTNA